MKIKMLIIALVSSAAFCANASGFDLLDRMLCRTGCGAGTSCCGTPVESNCCGTPATASSCCDGNPCGGLLARPLFGRRCATPCGGCGMNDCGGGCSGIQTGVCNDTCCGHRRLLDMDFSLNLRCLLPKFRHCGGCDSGCGGCDTGCDSGCGCNSCGRTIVRRPMMFGCNSCNSCDSGCGCDTGCGTPRVGLLDRVRFCRPLRRRGCCNSGCDTGCSSGCGQHAAPVEMEQKVEPQPEGSNPTTGRYPSAPIVDPNAFIVPKTHYAGQ